MLGIVDPNLVQGELSASFNERGTRLYLRGMPCSRGPGGLASLVRGKGHEPGRRQAVTSSRLARATRRRCSGCDVTATRAVRSRETPGCRGCSPAPAALNRLVGTRRQVFVEPRRDRCCFWQPTAGGVHFKGAKAGAEGTDWGLVGSTWRCRAPKVGRDARDPKAAE